MALWPDRIFIFMFTWLQTWLRTVGQSWNVKYVWLIYFCVSLCFEISGADGARTTELQSRWWWTLLQQSDVTAAGTTDVKFSMVLILQQISAAATCGTEHKIIDINLRYSVFLWRTSVLLSVSSHLQMSKETLRSVRSCDGAVNTSACY